MRSLTFLLLGDGISHVLALHLQDYLPTMVNINRHNLPMKITYIYHNITAPCQNKKLHIYIFIYYILNSYYYMIYRSVFS